MQCNNSLRLLLSLRRLQTHTFIWRESLVFFVIDIFSLSDFLIRWIIGFYFHHLPGTTLGYFLLLHSQSLVLVSLSFSLYSLRSLTTFVSGSLCLLYSPITSVKCTGHFIDIAELKEEENRSVYIAVQMAFFVFLSLFFNRLWLQFFTQ